uniref:Secreted protein n=1 Tax=Arcella intermedia TaxID=1963864 RepID=A0A6B2LT09_9EUKA
MKLSLMVLWMIFSVSISIEAVASSITSILELCNRERAIHNNCLWPSEKFLPPSVMTVSIPDGRSWITFSIFTFFKAAHISSAPKDSQGSRLE